MTKKTAIKSEPEKHFKSAGVLWIELYGELLPPDPETKEKADPEFWTDGTEKKYLKEILVTLRSRAEKLNVEWTEEEMKKRLRAFLLCAWDDWWLKDHWLLRMINQNKSKIINNQIAKKNAHANTGGKNGSTAESVKSSFNISQHTGVKSKGGFGKL